MVMITMRIPTTLSAAATWGCMWRSNRPGRRQAMGVGGQDNNDEDHGRHHKMLTTTAKGGTANASEGQHGKMMTARGNTRRRVEWTKGRMMTARGFTARGGNGEGRHRVDS
jgi:hypothetical protein